MDKRVLSALLCIVFIAASVFPQSPQQTPVIADQTLVASVPHVMPPNPGLKDKIERGVIKLPAFTDDTWQQKQRRLDGTSPADGAPLIGSIRALVVLVDFSDQVSTVTPTYFDTLMFAAPVEGRGSVRDYFHDVSYGAVDIITVNYPSGLGWRRAPSPKSYYLSGGNYCMGSYPNNCQKLAEDITDAIDPYVNFAAYDANGDGEMEPLVIVHSGRGAEFSGSAGDIWSHSWGMRNYRHYDNVYEQRYIIQPEYWQTVSPTTSDMTIGVYCHEMGHGFWGLPDLYDTDESSEGVGSWSLMGGGSWNGHLSNGTYGYYMGDSPAWPDAWSRIQMGFVDPTTVGSNTTSLTIPQAYNNPPPASTIFKLRSSLLGPSEYFLIENREMTPNTYDEFLPGQGMLIWHIDEARINNRTECKLEPNSLCGSNHYLVAVEQADGLLDLENGRDRGDTADPFPGTANIRAWNQTTRPSSTSYFTSGNTFISATNISDAAASMTASVTVGLDIPGNLTATAVSTSQINLNWIDTSNDETNFRIERSVDGGSFVEIAAVSQNTTSYNDYSVTCGHTYVYRLRAYRSLDAGSYSNYSNTATSAPTCPLPGAFVKRNPGNGATGQAVTGLILNWDPSSAATSYEWCYNTSASCAGSWTPTTSLSAPMPTLNPGQLYYWQVRARNSAGTTDSTGGWFSFTTLPLPGQFVKAGPINGETGLPINNLTLSWVPSGGATSYEYCYNTSATCPGGWTITTQNSAPIGSLTPGLQYYWQVRARNASGTTDSTGGWYSFTTLAAPGAFAKSGPGNGTANHSINAVTLSWGPSGNATSYDYCYNTSATCPGDWSNTNLLSAALPELTPGTTYYWQVRARNINGVIDSNSGWWSFSTLPLPGAFDKESPINNASGQLSMGLILRWSTSSRAVEYEYCYNTTPSCPTVSWHGTTVNSTDLSDLTPGQQYYWQVRARNASGTTDSNGGWYSFTVLPMPESFNKTSPSNGATVQPVSGLSLQWANSANAARYEYCYNTSNTCPGSWSSTTSLTVPLPDLDPGTRYYWQVRAINTSGVIDSNGDWYSFTTANNPAPFSKSSPGNGAPNQPIHGLALSWGISNNAQRYEYCYSAISAACPNNNWTTTTALTVPLPDLTPGTTYYWQVRARNADGVTDSNGGWYSFTTLAIPNAFGKVSPANGAIGQPFNNILLDWEDSGGAEGYDYCLSATSPACPGSWTPISASSLTLNLDPGHTYYWQVRARNSSGSREANGGWYSFTTAYLPRDFAKTAPTDGAVDQPTRLNLSWDTSVGAVSYEYCVSTTADVCPEDAWTSTGSARTATISGLDNNTLYYWQVRARNGAGTTDSFNGWWSFTTGNWMDLFLPMINH